MVDAVTGRAALASLTGTSAADQISNRKNPLLPIPLNLPQQGGNQRANAILQFDRPRVSSDVFATLQNSAQLSATRRVATLEERTILEAELRRRIQVTETGGSPGRPATPDSVNTVTIREGTLDSRALSDLQGLIDGLRRAGSTPPSRFIPGLSEELQDFGEALGSNAQEALTGIIRRIETSVLGDGFDWNDVFRDPKLFFGIGFGLIEFSGSTNQQAANALEDVIRKLAQGRLYDDNPNNDSLKAVGSAIDRLRRALDDESNAAGALDRFLDRIGGPPAGGNAYANRIADILDETLDDLKIGSLDLQAIEQLQQTLAAVRNLENISGNADDRLRDDAAAGVQGIIDQYASITTRTQTTRIPGEPAIPATPGEKTLVFLEEPTLVPSVELAERVVTLYQSAQESLRPLQKLSEPPPPVPNLRALVTEPEQDDDEQRRNRFVIGAEDSQSPNRFGVPQPGEEEPRTTGFGQPPYRGFGQIFDSRV